MINKNMIGQLTSLTEQCTEIFNAKTQAVNTIDMTGTLQLTIKNKCKLLYPIKSNYNCGRTPTTTIFFSYQLEPEISLLQFLF